MGKEANSHVCKGQGVSSTLGLMECAPTYCVSEVQPGLFQCVNKLGLNNQQYDSKTVTKSQFYKKLQACQTIDLPKASFKDVTVDGATLYTIKDTPNVLISDLNLNNVNLKNGAVMFYIENSQNVIISGGITLDHTVLTQDSVLFVIKNSTVKFVQGSFTFN